MRQGQQNRRGRGRNNNNNNNNRKGGHHHNPLSRSFESNGPDVKIRGTPAHIAEKYMNLARDAQSSGDPVLAENYLQHAEHYGRIIMAYREQLNPQGEGMNGNGQQRTRAPGELGDGGDEFGEDDGGEMADDGFPQPFGAQPQQQQIRQDGNRQESSRQESNRQEGRQDGNRHDRPYRRDQGRDQGRNRERYNNNDRNDRGDRGERTPSPEARPQPADRPQEPAVDGGNDARRRDRFQQPHEQPEFLRRPVRRARAESSVEAPEKDDPPRD